MVYMLRIQMFGEQARELLVDEDRPGPPRHPERLDRLLRRLSLPKPDRVRPIFKSGFFLCYYDDETGAIIRDLRRNVPFDDKTKKILLDLNIAYMLLTIVGHRTGVLFDTRIRPRENGGRRSRSRSPAPAGTFSKPGSKMTRDRYGHDGTASNSRLREEPDSPWQRKSDTGWPKTAARPGPVSNMQRTPSGGSMSEQPTADPTASMMQALQVLQNSATMKALLQQDTQKNEVVVKREEIEMPLNSMAPVPDPVKHVRLDRTGTSTFRGMEQHADSSSPAQGPSPGSLQSRPKIARDRYSKTRDYLRDPVGPHASSSSTAQDPSVPTGPKSTRLSSRAEKPPSPILPSSHSNAPAHSRSRSPGLSIRGAERRALPPLEPPMGVSTTAREAALTRDLWDIRRQVSALRAKESKLMDELKSINPSADVKDQSDSVKTEVNSDISLADLEAERKKRKQAEEVWEDARREFRAPLVVPAMLEAFEKLAQIAGEALVASTPPPSNKMMPPPSEIPTHKGWGPRKTL